MLLPCADQRQLVGKKYSLFIYIIYEKNLHDLLDRGFNSNRIDIFYRI